MSVPVADRPKPILRYPGAKWRLADWIVSHFPSHEIYCEPYCGSAAALFAKPPARQETINDLDGRVIGLFRVLRERPADLVAAIALTPFARWEYEHSDGGPVGDPVEDARRFLIRVWMAHAGKQGARVGWRHDMYGGRTNTSMPREWARLPDRLWAVVGRLKGVHLECRPALDVIAAFRPSGALLFVDPPYVFSSRYERTARYYRHEMTDGDHLVLLDALDAHPGPVVLSGYGSDLYDGRLSRWRRIDRTAIAYQGAARIESLWLNPIATATARQQPLFALPLVDGRG